MTLHTIFKIHGKNQTILKINKFRGNLSDIMNSGWYFCTNLKFIDLNIVVTSELGTKIHCQTYIYEFYHQN